MYDMTMKKCATCGKLKHESAYYANKANKDGLQHNCIPCNKDAVREWQRKNPNPHKYADKVMWNLDE